MLRRLLHLFGPGPGGRVKLLGAAVVACVACVAIALSLVYRADTSADIRLLARQTCVEVEKVKTQIRGVFEDGLVNARERRRQGDLTDEEWERTQESYRRQIARFAPINCK